MVKEKKQNAAQKRCRCRHRITTTAAAADAAQASMNCATDTRLVGLQPVCWFTTAPSCSECFPLSGRRVSAPWLCGPSAASTTHVCSW